MKVSFKNESIKFDNNGHVIREIRSSEKKIAEVFETSEKNAHKIIEHWNMSLMPVKVPNLRCKK